MNTTKRAFPAFIVVVVLLWTVPDTQGQDLSIETLHYGTNPSNSPLADFLSGIPGNSANDISVGIALENLCGQIFSDTTPLTPQVFNAFDLCFGVVGPVLAALDPEDKEFAQFVQESAGLLLGVSGQEVAAMAGSFTQLVPGGAVSAQDRLSRLRLTQADSPTDRALAWDSRTGELTFDLASGGGAGDAFGNRWRFYVNGNATTGKRDTTELVEGYDLRGVSVNGGGDYQLKRDRFIGFNLAVDRADLDYVGGSDGKVTAYDAAAYALLFRDNGWYLQGYAGLGSGRIKLSRGLRFRSRSRVIELPDGTTFLDLSSPIETVATNFNSDTHAGRVFATLGTGRDIQRGPVTIGVSGSVDYLKVNVNGYSESTDDPHGDPLKLEIDDYDHRSLRFIAAADVSRAVSTSHGVVTPFVRGEWIHEFEDNPTEIRARFAADPFSAGFVQNNPGYSDGVPAVNPQTGQPDPTTFIITSDNPDTDYFQLSTGASAVFPQGVQAFISLEGLVGLRNFERYTLHVGVSKEF